MTNYVAVIQEGDKRRVETMTTSPEGLKGLVSYFALETPLEDKKVEVLDLERPIPSRLRVTRIEDVVREESPQERAPQNDYGHRPHALFPATETI